MAETVIVKKRILFVDDDTNVLEGLRRMLRSMRHQWEMEFTVSGREALQVMDGTPFDLVVSDMRMPEMNGVELLEEVQLRSPASIRFILSGHADSELTLRSVGVAHQFLSKPCDAETLIAAVGRAAELRSLLGDERLVRIATQIGALPSLPSLRLQLTDALHDRPPSLVRIGQIVARDISMTAKVLQIVNSAFFGLPRPVSNPLEAVTHLGVERMQLLVLSTETASQIETEGAGADFAVDLWNHAAATGTLAKRIAESEQAQRRVADESFAAGLLHDVGKLILATHLNDLYRRSVDLANGRNVAGWMAEREVFGATHADVGAYLLGLWGLPDPIVEAVAMHHRPRELSRNTFGALTAVHVANALDHASRSKSDTVPEAAVDSEYLNDLRLIDRLPQWREGRQEGGA